MSTNKKALYYWDIDDESGVAILEQDGEKFVRARGAFGTIDLPFRVLREILKVVADE
jgi:hypothetical protein